MKLSNLILSTVAATSSINDLLVCSVWPGETVDEAQIKKSECDELREVFSSSNGDVRYISRTATHGLCIDLDCVKQARQNNYPQETVEPVKTATIYGDSVEHKALTPKREMIPVPIVSVSNSTSPKKTEPVKHETKPNRNGS